MPDPRRSARPRAAGLRASRLRTRLTADRGAAAVELAIVLPIVVALLFAIVDGSRAFNAAITLNEAAAEAARTLALTDTRTTTTTGAVAAARRSAETVLEYSTVRTESMVVRPGTRTCPGDGTAAAQGRIRLSAEVRLTIPVGPLQTVTVTGAGARQCRA